MLRIMTNHGLSYVIMYNRTHCEGGVRLSGLIPAMEQKRERERERERVREREREGERER